MRNVSGKNFRQNQNIFYVQFFFLENRALYVEKYSGARQGHRWYIIRHIRVLWLIITATITHSEFIMILVCARQKLLRLYMHCLICITLQLIALENIFRTRSLS